LFGSNIIERSIPLDRSTESDARTKTVFVWLVWIESKGRSCVQRTILKKKECIAVEMVESGPSLYIDGPSRASSRLGLKTMVNDLEVADCLWRELRATATAVLVVVIDSIDINRVATGTKSAEAEPASALREALLQECRVPGSYLWGEQDERQMLRLGIGSSSTRSLSMLTTDEACDVSNASWEAVTPRVCSAVATLSLIERCVVRPVATVMDDCV
jgi:hypothetical protein